MADVEVIRAADGPVARRRDIEGKGVRLDRIRVAAYVRVMWSAWLHYIG